MRPSHRGREVDIIFEKLETQWMPSKLWSLLIALLVVLTFTPYVAIPLGSNTNIPFSSVISLIFLGWLSRFPKIFCSLLAIFSLPLLLSFLRILVGMGETSTAALIVFSLHILPLAGFCGAVLINANCLRVVLALTISACSIYAIIQKYLFLDRGSIPFLNYYNVPGYASVEAQATTIVQYIRRPFALFPESSFMAGSIALALVVLLLLSARNPRVTRAQLIVPLSTGVFAIFLSDSGSGLVSISLLLISYFWFYGKGLSRGLWLGVSVFVGGIVALQILGSRNTASNWSWDDRAASILGAGRYLFSDVLVTIFGAGRGATPKLFAQGDIPLEGLTYYHLLPDVYSVVMRLLLDLGIVGGGVICVYLMLMIVLAARVTVGRVVSICFLALWVTVAGLTISYDSAAWIWALPGAALGVWSNYRSNFAVEGTGARENENSSHHK